MARLSILLLLVAISYVHTSEGSYIGESFCGVCSKLWKGCHQWITSCFKKKANYDKLTLVYAWGPSLCEKEACTIPNTSKKTWTIHGLWPFKSNLTNNPKRSSTSSPPIDCTGTYDGKALSSIRAELKDKWPNIKAGGTDDAFWKHEYEKHGTCASDLKMFKSQLNYFRGTMDLYDKYDIKTILANGTTAVTPSNTRTYTLDNITSALEKGLGVHPNVFCFWRKKQKTQYLWEVRLCFDKILQPITCGSELVGGGQCELGRKVVYPPF